jgi:formylglycine-generating enzyme required for sulfatase activity
MKVRRKESIIVLLSVICVVCVGTHQLGAAVMDFVLVGDAGNATNTVFIGPITGGDSAARTYGAVDHDYAIGKTEVTNAQYVEFLNAKAASDPYLLYNPGMTTLTGGITQSGSSGSYTYAAMAGRDNKPASFVSVHAGHRFANWMNNGKGAGDTESGAYDFSGFSGSGNTNGGDNYLPGPHAANSQYWIPSADEWYKAAYYKGGGTNAGYWLYATGTDTNPTPGALDNSTANRAQYATAAGGYPGGKDVSDAGLYSLSPSVYGTLDQTGNLMEFTETFDATNYYGGRVSFGGTYANGSVADLRSTVGNIFYPSANTNSGQAYAGFRLAGDPIVIPEPATMLLLGCGALLTMSRKRKRA